MSADAQNRQPWRVVLDISSLALGGAEKTLCVPPARAR